MPGLEIPDPALVLLVGPAGSGKTTFAAREFAPDEVVSSDELRGLIGRDEADQTVSRAAFAVLHRIVERRLAAGRLTVVDATNVTRAARRALLRRAAAAGIPAVAIVFELPLAAVLEQNARRPGRVVEAPVVERQWRTLAAALARGALDEEGFAAIHRLRSPAEVAAARVVRRRPG
jgi:protein phosphatase